MKILKGKVEDGGRVSECAAGDVVHADIHKTRYVLSRYVTATLGLCLATAKLNCLLHT